ncbi:MAG: hypothetical protein R2860_12895 [Desulfobacterales bacterium]
MNKNTTFSEETRNALQNLLATQNLAGLATHGDGQPYRHQPGGVLPVRMI